jgi:hypothetical protein
MFAPRMVVLCDALHMRLLLSGQTPVMSDLYIIEYTYIHTYIHTKMHTYIHTYIHTKMHTYIHTKMYTYVQKYTYIQKCIHTYPVAISKRLPCASLFLD